MGSANQRRFLLTNCSRDDFFVAHLSRTHRAAVTFPKGLDHFTTWSCRCTVDLKICVSEAEDAELW